MISRLRSHAYRTSCKEPATAAFATCRGTAVFGTFNPLFPNGYYFSLAGFTGYVNLYHLKPTLTVKPLPNLSIMSAAAFHWRETTADAIYTQPDNPVPGTAGKGSSWTGAYAQLRVDNRFSK